MSDDSIEDDGFSSFMDESQYEVSWNQFVNTFRIVREVKDEPDRGMVIVVAAMLEEQLGDLLRQHFIDAPKQSEKILSGPLSSFSSRITLAYCLGLIHEHEYADLESIRKLRNTFAHSHKPANFKLDQAVGHSANLKTFDAIRHRLPPDIDFATISIDVETPRGRFTANALALFFALTMRVEFSITGKLDAGRFIERDARTTGGEHIRWLVDQYNCE